MILRDFLMRETSECFLLSVLRNLDALTLPRGVKSRPADEACLTWTQLTMMSVTVLSEVQQMFLRTSLRAEDVSSIHHLK